MHRLPFRKYCPGRCRPQRDSCNVVGQQQRQGTGLRWTQGGHTLSLRPLKEEGSKP